MSTEANKAIIRRLTEDLWNAGNLSVADELIADNFVNHNPGPGQTPDREAFKQSITEFHNGFSGIRFNIDDLISEGDKTVARGTFHGTHTGEFAGVSATGKDVMMSWIVILRIKDGRITERWLHYNELDFLTQLGVIPPLG